MFGRCQFKFHLGSTGIKFCPWYLYMKYMTLVLYWVPSYLYEKLFTMSCIGYDTQATDGYEEWVTYSKASSQGYTAKSEIGVTDLVK
jgi:hypothetical protein